MTGTSYTPSVDSGKYRTRTWLRGHLPAALVGLAPKGRDCGSHEWYRQSEERDACYHCEVLRPYRATPVSVNELVMLERAAQAGSRPAMDAIERLIRERAVHLRPGEPGEPLAL